MTRFELTPEPPNNRQKPRGTDGEQGELIFLQREDAEAGKSPIPDINSNDSWNKMKFDLKGKEWWRPKGELGENTNLWVLVRKGKEIRTRLDYLWAMEEKLLPWVEEVMDDPVGITGKDTPVAAVQWILNKTIPHQEIWQPSEGTPKEWTRWIMDSLEASEEWTTIQMVTHADSKYEKAKEQDIAADAPLQDVLYTLMGIAY